MTTLDTQTIEALAERLENCQLQVQDTHKITDDHPDMDWEDAYAIQAAIFARKLAREVRAKPGMPVWRIDENERPLSLVIMKAGREAIGVEALKDQQLGHDVVS